MSTGSVLLTQGTKAFAQRIARLFPDMEVRFASSDPIPQGLQHSGRYFGIPEADHPAFIHEMLKLALDRETGLLLPLGYKEALALSSSKLLFSEYGIEVLVPESGIMETFDKLENPPRELEPVILHEGRQLGSNRNGQLYPAGWSGLFTFSDDGSVFQCFSV